MPIRIKPTTTVYPCKHRSHARESGTDCVWVTWEAIEREHFNPDGSLVADFSRPLEVDPSRVKNHRYEPEP
ncbi:hypothetical protein DWU98_05265 [Dyella monticola]|uniref:Uncharacterized protein n=1 Tax=Dyella monticola TaxID=1927958 RepID=A0A370X5M5_9GAMM|nr:hypothetical protein [Dyella monticola]RDS83729.1 hypothetical protein DWU98_05265 [Dyella monticola]